MKRLWIQLDEQTLAALNRVARKENRRSEFVLQAIRSAMRRAEYRAMREAYRKRPDSPLDADDWSTAESYQR